MQTHLDTTARPEPTALLVLGMHRSGTSAFTGVLEKLGIPVPGEVLPPAPDNPTGFFENKAAYQFHDRLLAHLGSGWDDPFEVSTQFVGTAAGQGFAQELAALIQREFLTDAFIFAVKDPRMCRFIPLWKAALAQLGVQPRAIVPLRHPVEVAGSLGARNKFPRAKTFLLWLTHALASERETRGMTRSFVGYDGLLVDWRGTVDKLARDLALEWPKERARVENDVDAFLSRDLRHHDNRAPIGEGTRLDALVEQSWNALHRLVLNEADEDARRTLDAVQGELDAASRVVGPYAAWEYRAYSEATERLAYLEELERVLRAQNGEYFQAIAEAKDAAVAERERLEATHQRELVHETGVLKKETAKLESEIARLRLINDRLGWYEGEAIRLHTALHHETTALQALRNSTSWRITGPVRRIVHMMPPSATATLRRGAKAAWWTMTPWRMPERMAFLRERERLTALGTTLPDTQSQPSEGSSSASKIWHAATTQSPLSLFTVEDGPPRLSMVTDSINAGSLFGGVATALIFSALLAKRTGRKLRIVTRTQKADASNVGTVFRAHGIEWTDNIEFAFADVSDDKNEIDVNPDELFVTTSWWTTEATRAAVRPENILYILQEDERMFYAYGNDNLTSAEVMADRSIRKVINSELLHRHLKQDGIIGDETPFFEPSFPSRVYFPEPNPQARKRNFFFYARPHNARNLFERGVSVIETAIAQGLLDPAVWDIHFVGKDLQPITLARGVKPILLQNMTWDEYAAYVRSVDLALTLMYTPHPSYPPLDVAACGGIAVTNKFGVKTDLGNYSSSILCVESDVASLVEGLRTGIERALDTEERERAFAQNHIKRDWAESFEPVFERMPGNT